MKHDRVKSNYVRKDRPNSINSTSHFDEAIKLDNHQFIVESSPVKSHSSTHYSDVIEKEELKLKESLRSKVKEKITSEIWIG